tara:strand:- start:1562 stop:2200 length:639 start_codon:yes stop_codon:yes gene_type:complete
MLTLLMVYHIGSNNMRSTWNKGVVATEDMPDYVLDNSAELATVEKKQLDTPAALRSSSTTQETLRKVEAKGYDTLYGNFEEGNTPFKGVSVSGMTISELTAFSQASGAYGQYVKPRLSKNTYAYKKGYTSTPMGKYQIVGSTLRDLTNRMKLPSDTVFNKETQDKMFLFLARENVAKGNTTQAKRKNLRSIWEGFKHVDNATLDQVIAEIEQ